MAHVESGPLPLESRSLLILYATVTGTAQDVSQRLARQARRRGWQVSTMSVSQFNQAELLDVPLAVFVLPTTGNGAAPPSLIPFWNALLHPALPPDFFEDLRYAVFGLGDSSYGKYNWVAKKMSRRLDSLGATAVVAPGEGDDQNEWGIESTLPAWTEALLDAIDPLFPPPKGFTPLPLHACPPPSVVLTPSTAGMGAKGKEKEVIMWEKDVKTARVKKLERVTPESWFQDVRAVELELPGTTHVAGDVVEIRPVNTQSDVDSFLSSTGWTSLADAPYSLTPASPDQPLPAHFPNPCLTTLRHLLTYELDISAVPLVSFFEWLGYFSEGDMKEKLEWFITGEGQDDLSDYTLRPKRTITEVMYEFRAAKIPPEYILDLLPPLRARAFSISSSSIKHEGVVELLVAVVKYRTVMSVPRKGLCSTYIAGLSPGDEIQVRIEKGLLTLPPPLPESGGGGHRPLIMVGPGTGVAPFRALVEERVAAGADENMLFFGCRSIEVDYYYRSEWAELEGEGKLVMNVAPSRDQDEKVYVQHLIPKRSRQIWEWLSRGGCIYVCGSSKSMPKAVKKAFLTIVREEGGVAEGDDEKMWEAWEKEGRVVEETWG